ncbi:MAG: YdjY domain-containing protein [Planctomycetia bacterium]|jgi:hypothetical protein
MARQFNSSTIFGCLMLTILLVGLSGCTSQTKETSSEQGTVTEESATPNEATNNETDKQNSSKEELQKTVDELKQTWSVLEDDKKDEETAVSEAIEKAKAIENELIEDQPEPTEEGVIEVIKETKVPLGDPLVDNLKDLESLNKQKTVWVDKKNKQVIMLGRVVQRNAPLEMLVCPKGTKEHESILAVDTLAMVAHTALILVGAEQGKPVQFQPEYQAATGTPVAIDVVWKDKDGKIQKAKAQDWIQNMQTKKAMEHDWVFAGSSFWKDKETGKEMYLAEQGDFICVSNFPTAMLDLPIKSSQKNDALMFQAWEDRVPPLNTPVTIIMKPVLKQENKEKLEKPVPDTATPESTPAKPNTEN